MDTFVQSTTVPEKRFGLLPAKIGASFAHRISTEFPLEEALYSTATNALGGRTRTRVTKTTAFYEYGKNKIDGSPFPTKALPGASMYLEVQDLALVPPDDAKHTKWVCKHRDCKGQHWNSKDELVRGHGKQRDLVETARNEVYGQAHVYHGVIEIPGKPEKKDAKGLTVEAATAPVLMLVSDEQ